MSKMLSENVDGFGLPVSEAKAPNFEKLLKHLLDAANKHLELMVAPVEGEEDPLPKAIEKATEALEPKEEEPKEEKPKEEEPKEEPVEEAKKKIVNEKAAAQCVDYVLEHENEDYYNWCKEEGRDPKDLSNPHIYTEGLKAFGLKAD